MRKNVMMVPPRSATTLLERPMCNQEYMLLYCPVDNMYDILC